MILIIGIVLAFLMIAFIIIKMIIFIPPVKGENGIAVLENVKIGGVDQAVLIRSEDVNHPILLYLHSGPGTTEMSAFRTYHQELEKYFTVVTWEQRGTGKSYSSNLLPETMTIDQMVSDTGEVIQYLLKKFDKQKLFIAGHSWGTLLGILAVQKYPEYIYAYAGSGQEIEPAVGEKISFAYTLDIAKKMNNTQAIGELKQISSSHDYLTVVNNPDWYGDILTERKWLVKFGGEVYKSDNYNSFYVTPAVLPSEYTLLDFIHFAQGSEFSLKALWPEVMRVNLMESAESLSVPVFLFQGRHDYNTPSSLVEEYYNSLDAPKKELIWFENSGHHPMYEESKKYDSLLIEKLLPLANEK